MDKILFSIIIPTYNSENVIEKCLISIMNQNFTNYEVLIMDGLSTDRTIEKVINFNDPKIKIFSEKDEGIYDAMNKGIKIAKGEWLYFLGSDDELYDNNVLKFVFKNIKTSNAKIIYGNVKINGNAGWASNGAIYDGEFDKRKIITNNICHQSIFYLKEIFDKIDHYNISYKICADHDLNIRACALYKFEYLHIIITRFQGGGMSSKADLQFKKDFDRIIIKNHLRLLHKLNVGNRNILKEAKLNITGANLFKSIYLILLVIYKRTVYTFLQ